MAIRKRTLKKSKSKMRPSWIVDYGDGGARHIKLFKLKKEADAHAASVRAAIGTAVYAADCESVTVPQAGELWLVSVTNSGLEATTIAQYRAHLDEHITPLIGTIRLLSLTVPICRTFEDDMIARGCTPDMVRKVMTSLSSIITDAQERGLIERNPVKELRRLRKSKVRKKAPKVVVGEKGRRELTIKTGDG